MKKLSKLFFLAVLLLIGGQLILAQQTSARKVKGRVFSSDALPEIRLKFNKKFKFAGSHEFVLYERANAEQFFFVEAENKKIKRMFMLQFEGFLNGIDGQYNYNEPQSAMIGGLKYFSNSEFIPNVEQALKAVPDSDIARAARFLQDKGFEIMPALVFQRFVRILDDAKRREFIMLYLESADNDQTLKGLPERALENFKVLK